MKLAPSTECEKCKKQIGMTDYLVAYDGISSKLVAFHTWCDPRDPDLQRHHNITLTGLKLGVTVKEF